MNVIEKGDNRGDNSSFFFGKVFNKDLTLFKTIYLKFYDCYSHNRVFVF